MGLEQVPTKIIEVPAPEPYRSIPQTPAEPAPIKEPERVPELVPAGPQR